MGGHGGEDRAGQGRKSALGVFTYFLIAFGYYSDPDIDMPRKTLTGELNERFTGISVLGMGGQGRAGRKQSVRSLYVFLHQVFLYSSFTLLYGSSR